MTNREIAEKIAQLFASKDPNGEWWGHDTTLGDVPGEIERALDAKDRDVERLAHYLQHIVECRETGACPRAWAKEALELFQKPQRARKVRESHAPGCSCEWCGPIPRQEGSKGCKHQEKLDDGYCPRCHSGMYPSI